MNLTGDVIKKKIPEETVGLRAAEYRHSRSENRVWLAVVSGKVKKSLCGGISVFHALFLKSKATGHKHWNLFCQSAPFRFQIAECFVSLGKECGHQPERVGGRSGGF